MRRMRLAIHSRTGAAVNGGATHTRNRESTASRHASRLSGRVRSPRTTFNMRRKAGLVGVARQRADPHAGGHKRENRAVDGAGSSDDKDAAHRISVVDPRARLGK
jgi:hypothetical protein